MDIVDRVSNALHTHGTDHDAIIHAVREQLKRERAFVPGVPYLRLIIGIARSCRPRHRRHIGSHGA